jgi:hypothetical protein
MTICKVAFSRRVLKAVRYNLNPSLCRSPSPLPRLTALNWLGNQTLEHIIILTGQVLATWFSLAVTMDEQS